MSEIIYQNQIAGRLVAVARYAGPARSDGVDRTMIQVDLEGRDPLALTVDEFFALSGACGGLWASTAVPGCYMTNCPNAYELSVPHARRGGCPEPEKINAQS